jgi:GNAT superfamily N-acetyltransferase
MISLKKAQRVDCDDLHWIQVVSFQALLEKYQDYNTNPAAETNDRIIERFEQDFTDYYLIMLDEECIGMMRVCDYGNICRISPICILPEFQGRGYAQQAMALAETFYPCAHKWTLDTIAQESWLCYLYEKMGYHQTGKFETIKDGMDIVYYEKLI